MEKSLTVMLLCKKNDCYVTMGKSNSEVTEVNDLICGATVEKRVRLRLYYGKKSMPLLRRTCLTVT